MLDLAGCFVIMIVEEIIMKSKTLAVFLCLLLAVPFMNGCGKQLEMGSAVTDSQSGDDSPETVIPDEAKQKLQAALDVEPITIPAEEWTVDTICQSTYFLGKNISVPCTLSDFGEGLEIMENDEYSITFDEKAGIAGGLLTYYGTCVGHVVLSHCSSKDDIFKSPIMEISISLDKSNEVIPSLISCNGAGLGDSRNVLNHELAFMDEMNDSMTRNDDYCVLEKKIENFRLSCIFSDEMIDSFTIQFEHK
jgi:hypothetical protein